MQSKRVDRFHPNGKPWRAEPAGAGLCFCLSPFAPLSRGVSSPWQRGIAALLASTPRGSPTPRASACTMTGEGTTRGGEANRHCMSGGCLTEALSRNVPHYDAPGRLGKRIRAGRLTRGGREVSAARQEGIVTRGTRPPATLEFPRLTSHAMHTL
jgi:hypothetical protein